MPKSKKARTKKYHPKTVKVGPYWSPEAQADVEAKLTQVALYVESSLPAGTLTDHQMDWIEDTLNWFLALLYKRYKNLAQQEIDEVGPIAMAARKAVNAINDRKINGQTAGFVATGDEIKVISQAFAIIIPTLKEAVTLAPYKTLSEFTWAYQRANERLKRKNNETKESKKSQVPDTPSGRKHRKGA